ncbi:ATP-grasp domain-containing protein [Brevundimonas goettingensis]|uniref:Transporter n=1 Tax=Brevundimonas goettingensis TaxID=2774190 RepID=A0A975C346_9CAUL|nr:transporter [Brevundimonas goettingensis]QTC90990.1 transporter [Brevundimonas goettingensis]
MTTIAILTPDPADSSYRGQWPQVLARLEGALAGADIVAVPESWVDHVEEAGGLTRFPLVLPVLLWGYHRDHARFMQAVKTWTEAGVPLANPASVLGWNSDKSYLARLEAKGVPIPPTRFTDRVTEADVEAAFAAFGAEELVIKPTVSGGAWKTLRLKRGEALADAPEGAAMIQPYLPAIASEGETSLLFFGGTFSHAVNKTPVPGDFRIQVQFGGTYVSVEPPAEAMALAQQVLAAIDEPLLYARIDMTRDGEGRWVLMEAELIEPDFYLKNDPRAGAGFAEAVRARLER